MIICHSKQAWRLELYINYRWRRFKALKALWQYRQMFDDKEILTALSEILFPVF